MKKTRVHAEQVCVCPGKHKNETVTASVTVAELPTTQVQPSHALPFAWRHWWRPSWLLNNNALHQHDHEWSAADQSHQWRHNTIIILFSPSPSVAWYCADHPWRHTNNIPIFFCPSTAWSWMWRHNNNISCSAHQQHDLEWSTADQRERGQHSEWSGHPDQCQGRVGDPRRRLGIYK